VNTEDELRASWIQLNDFELTANARRDARPERDLEESPWTEEDHENVRRMVQEMTGRLERIEMRQSVLFEANQAALSAINRFKSMLLTAAVAWIVVSTLQKWLS